MRTFKNVSAKNQALLDSTFPMLLEEDWSDSTSLNYRAISIWDHWLGETNEYHLLVNVNQNEQRSRDNKFRLLHASIIENLKIFNARFSKKWRFKETRSKSALYNRLDPSYKKGSSLLLLPEIEVIYSYEGDDTAVIWYQNGSLLTEFDRWVEEAGLKYIKSKT